MQATIGQEMSNGWGEQTKEKLQGILLISQPANTHKEHSKENTKNQHHIKLSTNQLLKIHIRTTQKTKPETKTRYNDKPETFQELSEELRDYYE